MSTILSKLRTVTLGNLHDLLDSAIDMNSPSALRQSIRDLETARTSLARENVEAGGEVRTQSRTLSMLQGQKHVREEKIRQLLQSQDPNAQAVMKAEASVVSSFETQIAAAQTALTTATQLNAGLTQALARIDARHEFLVNQLNVITVTAGSARAKEHAAQALEAANALVGNGLDLSIDHIQKRIQHSSDVADEHFDQAMQQSQNLDGPETSAAADEVIARIKAESGVVAGAAQ